MKFKCPSCWQSLEADDDMEGMQVDCPSCNEPIVLKNIPDAAPFVESPAPEPPPIPNVKPKRNVLDWILNEPHSEEQKDRNLSQRPGRGAYILSVAVSFVVGAVLASFASYLFLRPTLPSLSTRSSTTTTTTKELRTISASQKRLDEVRQKWQQLRLGMSQADVQALLGKPSGVAADVMGDWWYYRNVKRGADLEGSDGTAHVTFSENQLVNGWDGP